MTAQRKRYVPLGLHFAHGDTGTAIMDKLGCKGLLVWVCLMAAAKRSTVQGQYIHLSDQETWANFGLLADPPAFTFDEFLTLTGRMKQTRKTRSGRLTYVTLTHWADWNKAWKQDADAEQKSSKRGQSAPDMGATDERQPGDIHSTECEGECESEVEEITAAPSEPPQDKSAVSEGASSHQELFAAIASGYPEGEKLSPGAAARVGKAAKELAGMGVTADEAKRRVDAYRRDWPTMTYSPRGLTDNWPELGALADRFDAGPDLPEWVRDERVSAEVRDALRMSPRVPADPPAWFWSEEFSDVMRLAWVETLS